MSFKALDRLRYDLVGFFMCKRVMNALPIEGLLQKGFLCEVADDGPFSLADQVSGVYFGWEKLNTDEILKVVVGIG
ncbi:hypothetical protein GIB67_034986 [Kingdonia uniflora]|uniref:Uncharacterized protein n=1 Tax=Kingdonia uniflora TaxID=39325 RepID=A0A7J7NGX7_9MAGN|nr:hypothetical protein GIB67_034986 [Kingdonia uniflora]